VRALKLIASRLGAAIHGYAVATSPEVYREHFQTVRPDVPLSIERARDWSDALTRIETGVRPDDLVVVLSARRGAVSWSPVLERLPARLAQLVPESFVMLYLSEVMHERAEVSMEALLSRALIPGRILVGVRGSPYPQVIRSLLETAFAADPARLEEVAARLIRSEAELTTEIRPGVVVPHARIPWLREPMLFLATSREGVEFPGAEEPAHLIFILLSPQEDAGKHLSQLAEIARLASDSERVRMLVGACSAEDLQDAVRTGVGSDPLPA
jgi:mannitol/fructose-specific phosphotransferase system IIA component (Ntr-type)